MNEKRTHIDLFSGIGGFALAARWNGFDTVQFCERDPYCQKLLAQHWPGVPICDDIHKLRGTYCDLLTGGFPCQPYSVAGKRRGAADDRALWPEMLRFIAEGRPRWVVGENVAGFVKMGLDQAVSDLESVGYSCWSFIIPAVGVDARHNRDRVWIVAHSTDAGPEEMRQWEKSPIDIGGDKAVAHTKQFPRIIDRFSGRGSEGNGRSAGGRRCEASGEVAGLGETVADTECCGLQGQGRQVFSVDSKQGQGWEAAGALDGCQRRFWPAEPGVGRVAHGVSNRVDRIKGLGNAIVPQVAAEIIRCIVELDTIDAAHATGTR